MENIKDLFKSYNNVIGKAHEHFYFSLVKKIPDKSREKEQKLLDEYVLEQTDKWENSASNYLGGLTPLEYFGKIKDFDKLIELFMIGAKECDSTIPESLLSNLRMFGNRAEDKLLEIALDEEYINADIAKAIKSLSALETLGRWKVERFALPIIDFLFYFNENEDTLLFKESIMDALISIGEASIEPAIKRLDEAETIEDPHEYLMIVISDVGANNKSDKIYKCLKETFFKMKNKGMAATCLANYGDGRIIPALRGYVEKNRENIDSDELSDIACAIKKLGGNTSDITKTV